jgi:hypothetical protein
MNRGFLLLGMPDGSLRECGPLESITKAQSLINNHAAHAGVFYVPECPDCQEKNVPDLIKLPRATVDLSDCNGNAIAVVQRTMRALRGAGWTRDQCDAFRKEALTGDYDHVLQTCMKYAEVA